MPKLSKRVKEFRSKVSADQQYSIDEALDLLKDTRVKFVESVDISVNLGVDPRKSDQVVRGATLLPKGTGRVVRVAVFAEGDDAKLAQDAGADIVGLDDLAAKVKAGEIDFDVAIATPSTMRVVGQLGQVLGPRGLMPNPKVGTVTKDVVKAINEVKAGQVRYRVDKAGIIHCTVGKIDFSKEDLIENITALLADLKKAKPPVAKGVYMKKVTLSTTMGPGIAVDQASLAV